LTGNHTGDHSRAASYFSPCGLYLLTYEDDGKVAYAYLKQKEGRGIVGDVWLYNRCPTPAEPEWSERSNIPFANCQGFMTEEGRMLKAVQDGDVTVEWEYEDAKPVAYIYIHGMLYGVVGLGDKPGCARFALRDGPLARVMEIED
jgi:hypothetical protein